MSPRERVSRAIYSLSESSNVRLSLALAAITGVVWLVKGSYDLRDGVSKELAALRLESSQQAEAFRLEITQQTQDLRREVQDRYVTREYIDARLTGTQQVLEARIDGTERVLNARMDALSQQILTLVGRSNDSRGEGDKK